MNRAHQTSTPPDFATGAIAALMAFAESDRPPPVDSWHPDHCGAIDIRIAADGQWFHEGSPIKRPALVRLFSRVLRREQDGSHVLVTPAEKLCITVDDAPFVAQEMRRDMVRGEARLTFRLSCGTIVTADAQHPLRLRDGPAGILPYLHVRGALDRPLEARLARPVYYDLAELVDDKAAVESAGCRFIIGEPG